MKRIILLVVVMATMLPTWAQKNNKANDKILKSTPDSVLVDAVDSVFCDTGFCDSDECAQYDTLFNNNNFNGNYHPSKFEKLLKYSMDDATDIAGITIVCIFVLLPLITLVLLPVFLLWLFFRHRRKKQQAEYDFIKSLAENGQDVSQYLNTDHRQTYTRNEQNLSKEQQPSEQEAYSNSDRNNNNQQLTNNRQMGRYDIKSFDKGTKNAIIGGIIAIGCWIADWPSIFILGGFIVCGVGISQIISAKNNMRFRQEDNYQRTVDSYSHEESANTNNQQPAE